MALETKTFFDIAQKNGLISESKLQRLRSGIKKDTLSDIDFDALVAKKVLTPWQAKRFLSGKGNFKVGRYRLLDFIGKDEFGEVYLVKGEAKSYLRLVSKELCADNKRREQYLARVNAFKKLDLSRFPKITDVSKIGERLIVVSEIVNGTSIAKRCTGKSQSEKLVKQITAKLYQSIVAMEAKNLKHGSINEHSVIINESQKVMIQLPREFSVNFSNDANSTAVKLSDVPSTAALACGMLAGNFENPVAEGSLFKQFAEVAANTTETNIKKSLKKLEAILGENTSAVTSNQDDDSVVDSVPQIPNLDNVSIDTAIPSVDVDGLENIGTPKTDMFGDLDDMSIESAIQAQPQKIIPAVVETDLSNVKTDSKSDLNEANSSEDKPQPNSQKTIVLAALGGAVGALSIGLIVYFVFFSGGDNGSKVADASTSASSKITGERTKKSNPAKDPVASSDSKREKKKLDTTSSGLFANVGALNKKATTETSESKDLKSGNSTAEKAPIEPQEKKDVKNSGGDLPAVGQGETSSENAEKNGETEKTDVDPSKPPAANPDEKKANDKAVGKAEDDSKNKMDNAGPVILIGKATKKDKDEAKPGDRADFDKLFANAPRAVTLPELNSQDPLKLFNIAIPPSLPLTVTLHGGDKATRGKFEFLMRASTSENATWVVSMKTKSAVTDPIAKFMLKGQSFEFSWTETADSQSNAKFLMNCGLKISARRIDHKLALREPVESSLLTYERGFSPTAEAKLSDLPAAENIKIQLVNFSEKFPARSFVGKKEEIIGRTGSITIVCKPENIDTLKTKFTSRTRGSKMFVNGESHFVTPDKREIKLSSLANFEAEANREIARITQLQINFAELMNQYNQIEDPNQKRELTIQTNRLEIEKQVKADKPIKAHLERAIGLLNSIKESTIGVRIFFQAGELEVDLATPDGKPYNPPKPVEEEKKK